MYVRRGYGGLSVLRSTQITFRSRSCLTNLSVQYCCHFVNIPRSRATIKRQSAVHRHHASQHTCCLVLMTAGILYQHICCWPCCRNTSATPTCMLLPLLPQQYFSSTTVVQYYCYSIHHQASPTGCPALYSSTYSSMIY